jgi:hypothetical protein
MKIIRRVSRIVVATMVIAKAAPPVRKRSILMFGCRDARAPQQFEEPALAEHRDAAPPPLRELKRATADASRDDSRLSSGAVWETIVKRADTPPATRCVGEVGTTSSGYRFSSARSSSTRRSYASSEISGRSST